MKRIIVRRAAEGETVEIQWTLSDGSVYWERYSLPPPAVRVARIQQRDARSGLEGEGNGNGENPSKSG